MVLVLPPPFRELVRAPGRRPRHVVKYRQSGRFFGNLRSNCGTIAAQGQGSLSSAPGFNAASGLLPRDCHIVCSNRASTYLL